MKTHLIEEKKDLDAKIKVLGSKNLEGLCIEEQLAIRAQLEVMQNYSEILETRIKRFG